MSRRKEFAFRRLYAARFAPDVTEFATVNVKDCEGFGFRKMWPPMVA